MQHLGVRALWRPALQTFIGAMLGAFLLGMHSLTHVPRNYRASATLIFPLNSVGTPSLINSVIQNAIEVPTGSDFPLDTYRAVLTSDRALLGAAKELGIDKLYKIVAEQDIVGFMRNAITAEVDVNRTLVIHSQLRGTPSVQETADLFHRGPANARDDKYRLLTAQVLDELVNQMQRIADEVKLDRTKANLDAVTSQLALQQSELDRARERLVELQSQLGNLDPQAYAQSLTQLVVQARESVQQTTIDLEQAQRERDATKRLIEAQSKRIESLPEEVPFLLERREAVRKLKAEYEDASRKYGPESPQVLNAKNQLRRAEQELQAGLAATKQGLEPNLLQLDARIAALTGRLKEATRAQQELSAEAKGLPVALAEVTKLLTDVAQLQEAVAQLEQQRLAARMAFERQGVRWNVLDPPRPPLYKSTPRTSKALITGFLIGAMLAGWPFLLAIWRALLEKDPSEPDRPQAA